MAATAEFVRTSTFKSIFRTTTYSLYSLSKASNLSARGVISAKSKSSFEPVFQVADQHTHRWFGLVLLPIVSFAADGAVATLFFVRYTLRIFFGTPHPPAELAKGRAIDLSIQFTLFWLP
jgi:hypothetical protein